MSDPTPGGHVALVGNPNAGKTTLFNALTGLRMKTANYAGTTVSRKSGILRLDGREVELTDLPGMYSLRAATPEEKVASDVLLGERPDSPRPDALIVLVDATNLERNLFLFSQLTECDLPMVVGLSMVDLAAEQGIRIDAAKLAEKLGCPVIPVNAREGEGLEELKEAVTGIYQWGAESFPRPHKPSEDVRCGVGCQGCPFHGRFTWSEQIAADVVKSHHVAASRMTESLDEILTHRVVGVFAFFTVMAVVFYLIFSFASLPMDLIDGVFGRLGDWVEGHLPDNDLRSLLVDGVIGGVGGILVFLPQIVILFFFLALLEDTGYLARAAFVMDRLMRRVGLPGTAFVPMLSGHACAIPAILSTRVIADPRDRLATILVVPLMSCSARIPVYAMLVALLFPHSPGKGALLFTGAYATGIVAALAVAFVLKKTILPGESQPLLLELPSYKGPNLKNALHHTAEKAMMFVKQAGTVILLISMALWALSTYPKSEPPPDVAVLEARGEHEAAAHLEAQHALAHSYAGQLGHFIEPVLRPLGFDWQIGIGVISSFAAREVIVSTLSIVYGLGEEGAESEGLIDTMRQAKRSDGTPIFTTATCLSLLMFYILAMQCLPTQAATRAETGSWKWAAFQLLYMSALAYGASLLVFQGLRAFGVT